MSNSEKFREKEVYREKIVEMVGKIESLWTLQQIFRFIKNINKKGD